MKFEPQRRGFELETLESRVYLSVAPLAVAGAQSVLVSSVAELRMVERPVGTPALADHSLAGHPSSRSGSIFDGVIPLAAVGSSAPGAAGGASHPQDLSPGGVLQISGNTALIGTTQIQIGGATPGSGSNQYDQIVMASGQLTLGGTLQVSFKNGFAPAIGDTFDIVLLNSSGAVGNFASMTGLSYTSGGQTVYLVPVQAPGKITLVASALPNGGIVFKAGNDTDAGNLVSFFGSNPTSFSFTGQLGIVGLASVSGTFGIQVSGPTPGQVQVAADGVTASVTAGTFSASLSGGNFAMLLDPDGTKALQASGNLALTGGGFASIFSFASATLVFNNTAGDVNLPLAVGGASANLVAARGTDGLSVTNLQTTLFGFAQVGGDFAFLQQGADAQAVASNVTASVSAGSTSLGLGSGTLGLVYHGATDTEAIEASGAFTSSAGGFASMGASSAELAFNNSGVAYSGTTIAANGVSYTFSSALTAANEESLNVTGFTATISGFLTVAGNVAVESQNVPAGVSVSGLALASTMLTIGGANLTVFAGVNGLGVSLAGVGFGLALAQDANGNTYWGLEASAVSAGTATLAGLPTAWTVSLGNVSVEANQSNNGTGTPMVVATFTNVSVPTGGSPVLLNLSGPLLEAGGNVTIHIGSLITVTGTIAVQSPDFLVSVDGSLNVAGLSLPFDLDIVNDQGTYDFQRRSDGLVLISIAPDGTIDTSGLQQLGDSFSTLTGLLQQLSSWFSSLSGSSLLQTQIPFTGGETIGQVFNWSQAFMNEVLSQMTSVEIQSSNIQATAPNLGGALGGTLQLQINNNNPVAVTLAGSYTDFNSLAAAMNADLANAGLQNMVEARADAGGRLVLALTPGAVADGTTANPTTLSLVAAGSGAIALGFGSSATSGASPVNAVTVPRYNNNADFFAALGALPGVTPLASSGNQVTFSVLLSATTVIDLPFSFGQGFGPVGGASLSGELQLAASVSASFTLGFDLDASAAPWLVSSATVPAPANGRLSADARFNIILTDENGNAYGPFNLTLPAAATAGNASVSDLAADLNTAFTAVQFVYNGQTIRLGDVLLARGEGSSLVLTVQNAYLGSITQIQAAPQNNNDQDPFVTEMGFGNQVDSNGNITAVSNAPIKGLFIDHATLTGSAAVTTLGNTANPTNNTSGVPAGVHGSLHLGFVDVSTNDGVVGTYDANDHPTSLVLTLALEDQTTDGTKFYLDSLLSGLGSTGIANLFAPPALAGSFVVQFNNITVSGLGFALPLTSPQIAVWIPDATNLSYNPDPYDPNSNSEGLFVTYPSLGALPDLSDLGFAQIIQALEVVTGSLSQLSAFSFLNQPLPLIGKSVDQLIDYAGQLAGLMTGLSNNPAQTLQELVADLNTAIDQTFSLDPSALIISLDPTGGAPALEFKLNLSFAYANSLPFQLNLSQLAGDLGSSNPTVTAILGLASSLIQAQGSGALNVSVGANLTLDFGLDLTNPLAIRPFFYDDTGVALTAKVTGTNLNFQVGLGSVLGVSMAGGAAALSADGNPGSGPATISLTLSDPANSGRLYFDQSWLSSSNIHLTVTGGVGATLPLFAAGLPVGGSSPANNFVLSIPSLQSLLSGVAGSVTVTTPDFSSLFSNLDFGDLLFNDTGLLLNGLDTLLGDIESGLNTLVLNTRLPLVGDGLAKAADFIQDFRSGLLADLRADISAAGGSGVVALQNAVQQALWDSLGGGGLNLLVDANGNPLASASQVGVSLDAATGLSVTLHLSKQLALVDTTADPINLDLGVPGFGLTTTGNVIVKVGFSMDLSFGLDRQDGFYFDTPDNLTLSFSVTVPGLHFTGSLAFLQLDLADDPQDPSYFNGQFSVTLSDPNGGSKLTGAELTGGVPLSEFISWSLTATAYVNLDLVASFGGDASFPSVDAQFHLRWSFDPAHPGGAGLQVWFDNIGLDVGSFISGFLGSILNEVQQVTEPIQPILALVTERLPIISDLAGQTVTMLTLAEDFGVLDPSTAEFISDAAQVVTLINDIHGLGSGEILIPFGAFSLTADSNGRLDQITPMGGTPAGINFGAAVAANSQTGAFASASAAFAGDLGGLHNFDIPIFDHPSLLFNLFVGQPVTLVEWRMPEFQFQFTYTQSFAIYPPLFAQFGGSIEADINLGFAYDTYGIQEFAKDPSRNPADLLDGFYIITTDANGQPQPALTLTGQIFAGALLDLGVVSGGVNGGLEATVNFFWNDNSDNDGKMRFSEIAADAALGASCIFDIQGKISVFLEAFVNVDVGFLSLHKTWNLGDFTLVDFSITCPQPVLGSVDSTGDLTLNIGTLAGQRSVGDTSDGSETFIVRDAGGPAADETVDVTYDNHMEQFTHVRDILVLNPGQGDNVLDFRGVLAPVSVTSGPGNDTVYLSDGNNSVVYCGGGNDTIMASATATGLVVYGGDGNATITAGGQPIVVFGGSGDNVIKGSPGNDLIVGGGGNDTIYGEGGSDVIVTGPGDNTVYAASGAGDGRNFILADSWLFVMGDVRDVPDFVNALQTSSTAVSAFIWSEFSSSAKTLLTSGSATLQQKEVTLVGQLDSILLQQMNLDPRNPLSANPAPLYDPATFSGRFSGVALSAATQSLLANNPNPQGQVLVELERSLLVDAYAPSGFVMARAPGGADVIYGGSQGDVIDGGAGDDTVYGGAGNDLLVAGNGNTQIYGNGGNDLLIGGEVSSISQGSGNPISILPSNAAQLVSLLNNMAGANPQGLSLQGLTGGGTDLLVGGGGSDVIFGGKGNDIIYGGNLITSGDTAPVSPDGDNFISGGSGNDTIFTDDATAANTPPSPTGISIQSGIWYDANHNGMLDPGETGFAGVTVSLYTSANPPGSGAAVASTTTDLNGNFKLVGLNPNNYILVFSLPVGMRFVPLSTGTQAPDGSSVNAGGQTGSFALTYNQTFTAFSAGYSGPVTVSAGDASAQEGASGQTPMNFTIALSGAQAYPVQVQYQTVNGTASAANGDFVAASGSLTFNPGQTSQQVSVLVNGSTTYESDEQFQLEILSATLIKPTGATPLISSPVFAIGTIINPNPLPALNISSFDPGDGAGLEGMPATFAVTLSNPSSQTVTVHWQTDVALTPDGAPEAGAAVPSPLPNANYIAAAGALTFLPGVTSQVITVQTIRNNLDQDNLHFYVDLSNPTFATINQGHGFGLIRNIDPPVTVSFAPVTPPAPSTNFFQTDVTADPNALVPVTLQVTLSAASGREITVTYGTSPGTAVESVAPGGAGLPDYVGISSQTASGSLLFDPGGPLAQTITVYVNPRSPIQTDGVVFYVNLLAATNATIAANPGPSTSSNSQNNHFAVVIHDPNTGPNASPWSISFSSAAYDVQEPAAVNGSATVDITLVRAPGSPQAVAVFSTADGTATAGVDYSAVREIIQFAPDELTQTVAITIYNDGRLTGDETITLSLRNPTGGPVNGQPATATLTIHDPPPQLVVLPPSGQILVGNSSATATFEVELLDSGGQPLTLGAAHPQIEFHYQTVDMTAVAGQDYTAASGDLIIPAVTSSFSSSTILMVPITVTVLGRPAAELPKTFAVQLGQSVVSGVAVPLNASLSPQNRAAVATIDDNLTTNISGLVFYDANANGLPDPNDPGLAGVSVEIIYTNQGRQVSLSATTNASGVYTAPVYLGEVSVIVDGRTVGSPYPGMSGGGAAYATTTGNQSQEINFTGATGVPLFAPVGYGIKTATTVDPATSQNTGTGHTNSTAFGGPGDDSITVGNGNDRVVGGSWVNATDANAPVNQGSYDATVTAAMVGGSLIWSVATPGLSNQGSITGKITDDLGQPVSGQMVTLLDGNGDPVNAVPTDSNGNYSFGGLYVNPIGADDYVVQFDPPGGDAVQLLSPPPNVQTVGSRTSGIPMASSTPVVLNAAFAPPAAANSAGFQFGASSYSVSEAVQGGLLAVTIVRANSFLEQPVVLQTQDGSAVQGVNYTRVSTLLEFATGQTSATLLIPILDSNSIGFGANPLTFSLVLRAPTGAPLGQATVYVGGQSFGSITDNDTIQGGSGPDIILGDSGNIPAGAVFAYPSAPAGLSYAGGPGADTIYAGGGFTFVDGQLGDDTIYGGGDQQTLLGGPGHNVIYAGLGAETIDGGPQAGNTIASTQDAAVLTLASTSPADPFSGTLVFKDSGGNTLGTTQFTNMQAAELTGGSHDNAFDLSGWYNSAVVTGGGGIDTLNVRGDTDMILQNATTRGATLSLANGSTYAITGIANVSLTGGPGDNILDASGYSGAVTFHGSPGHDTMIGGSGDDTFAFDADTQQGTDTITGHGGSDTLDFSSTQSAAVTLDLSNLGTAQEVAATGAGFFLKLLDQIENVIDGAGDTTIHSGPGAHRIILLPFGAPQTVTVYGNGNAAGTTLDLSGFTTAVNLDLSNQNPQMLPGGLALSLPNADVDNIIGAAGGGQLHGNADDNTFNLTGGQYVVDGAAGHNTVASAGGSTFILANSSLSVDGVVSAMAGVQNVILTGGPGANLFDLTNYTGAATLNGGGGNNALEARAAAGIAVLTDSSLTLGGSVIQLNSIQTVTITASPGGATFDVTGWTAGSVTLNGAAGSNAVLAQAASGGTILLTNAAIGFSGANGPAIYLNSIQTVVITGDGHDLFDARGWTNPGLTLNGVGGNETVEAQASVGGTMTLTNNSITLGNGNVITLNSIQNAILYGGGHSTLDASAFSGAATLNAGAAGDRFVAGPGNETLIGGAGNDTFVFTRYGSVQTVAVVGNGGFDTLDFSAFAATGPVNVSLSSESRQALPGGLALSLPNADVDNFIGAANGGAVTINSGTRSVVGGGGFGNTVIAPTGSSFALTSLSLTINSSQMVALANIQNAVLDGDAGAHDSFTLALDGWPAGVVTLNGGAGALSNTFTLEPQTGLNPPVVTVNVNGSGLPHNTLDLTAFSGVMSLTQLPPTVVLAAQDIQTIEYAP